MIIITALVLLVPALLGVICYERFKGYEIVLRKRIELFAVFALLINVAVYATFWLRGWGNISWVSNNDSTAILTSFIVQYTIIALVAAVVIAYILSLVRITPSTPTDATETPENTEPDENTAKPARAKTTAGTTAKTTAKATKPPAKPRAKTQEK